MPDPLLTYRGTVYPWHCDHMGHMNVMWYVGKFGEATWHFFNAIGLSPTYLRNANRGMAAVDQQITYVRELYAGSIVSIYSRETEAKPKRLVFIHEMMNDEIHEVAARTTLTGVQLDTVARKSCPVEEHIIRAAQSLVP